MTWAARELATGLGAALAILCAAAVSAAQPAADGWSELPLPGGRAALLPGLGMAADLPRALVLTEAIRVIHAGRAPDASGLETLRAHAAATPPDESELVPVPLDPESLRRFLGGDIPDDRLLLSLLRDRRTAMLCYGLASVDAQTRAALHANPGLLERLRDRHASVFAAFGSAVVIRDGRLQLPGGSALAATWQQLLGERLDDVERAVTALLDKDDGRFAYFVDAVSQLWEPDLRLVFGPDFSPSAGGQVARDVYRVFAGFEPGWRPRDFPFQRAPADPALLLTMAAAVDERARRTPRFWSLLLARDRLDDHIPGGWQLLERGPAVETGWLLRQLAAGSVPERQANALLFAFATRAAAWFPDAPETLWVSEACQRYPALLLVLERIGVRDFHVVRRLVVRAGGLRLSNDAASEIRLALFQAPIALVDRLVRLQALTPEAAGRLLGTFADLDPHAAHYGRDVAGWLTRELLAPAGYDPSMAVLAEATLLESLAGLGAPPVTTLSEPIAWESNHSRIDTAAPELQRLTEVRMQQGGNTLDGALALSGAVRTLAEARDLDGVRAAGTALATVLEGLQPIEFGERRGNLPPVPVQGLVRKALDDTLRIASPTRVRDASAVAARLVPAEDAALADVLTSIVYALYLGDPDGTIFLAGNVARRHDYGLAHPVPGERARAPWLVPSETSGGGNPWHMAGSLLGLDVGLGRFALRRIRMDLPERQPTLVDADRQAFVTTLILTDPAALNEQDGVRLAGWIAKGRAIAATPQVADRLGDLGLDGVRREAVLWTAAHEPGEVPSLLLLTELLMLGRDRDVPISDAWGAAPTALTGALRLRLPAPPALQRYTGRAGAGLLPTRLPDLKLRIVELLVQYRLPVALTRAVLAAALQDALDVMRPAHLDDWHALTRHARVLTGERFEDYVATLTAGGPLIPTAAAPEALDQ